MANIISRLFGLSKIMKVLTIICLVCLLLSYLCPFVHPNDFWLLPFFGLAYPVILLFTIIFLIYWATVKSRMFFGVLIVILFGGKLHFRTISLPFNKEEINDTSNINTLNITSYNVRLFDLYEWGNEGKYENRNKIFKFLEEKQSDIICFQEFYQQDKPTKFATRDTLKNLLKTPYCHERYSHKLEGRQNFGIAMLSKYPMISRGDIMFDDPLNIDNNYCIFADIVKNKDTFRIYNVHLQSIKFKKDDYKVFSKNAHKIVDKKSTVELLVEKLKIAYPKRAEQARKVVEHMQQSPFPVIICGDFNDTPMSYTYNIFNSLYTDAFRNSSSGLGITYAGKVPAGRIDYIFHNKNLHSSFFTIQNEVYSDHKAISCTIWK
jgi:endonuclease/exonuclease/phosphatase family metal-dependent hydrolase